MSAVFERPADGCERCGSLDVSTLRKKKAAGGALLIAYQCLICGSKRSQWLPHEGVRMDDLDPWDEALPDEYFEAQRVERLTTPAPPDPERLDRQAKYAEYLQSDAWRATRARVLQRDGYLCRGCLVNRASQVHHLTYQSLQRDADGRPIGGEFCWELVAICEDCHARVSGVTPCPSA